MAAADCCLLVLQNELASKLQLVTHQTMLTNLTRRLILPITSAALIAPALAEGQGVDPAEQLTIVAGAEYEAGGLKRKLLGSNWRSLWVTPVTVPVWDFSTYAGGLHILERGGGRQTLSLHFQEDSGWREHHFRSVNKYPLLQAMPPALRGTLSGKIIQDQVTSMPPGGPLMVPPFLEAAGILHVKPKLFVMPDDPRLGIHRDTFALMLGTVELSPKEAPDSAPGFAGSRKILNAEKFLEEIETSRVHRLDERELLAARLIDFLINDVDRSKDNIRFARYGEEGKYTWRPIPRDRDRAFTDARGWLVDFIMRPVYPKLARFDEKFSLEGLVFISHGIDRRLLQRLTRVDVDSIARRVQRSITDNVIEEGLAQLPVEWRQTTATSRLRTVLRARRDQLPEFAAEFYDWLATDVDIHGTDEDERAIVDRATDGTVTVTVSGAGDPPGAEPYSRRKFLPEETREVRVYLHGGKDLAVVRGAGSDAIKVRIIGGKGDDILADSAGGGATTLYDSDGENQFVTTRGTRVSEKPWKVPPQGRGVQFDASWRPDWGRKTSWGPAFGFADGAGLFVGFGPRYKVYGFRRLPHRLEAGADLLYATGNSRPGVRVRSDYRMENSPIALLFNARATKFESFRFNGFGNDTPLPGKSPSLVRRDLFALEPQIMYQVGWRAREDLGDALTVEEQSSGDSAFRGLRPLAGKISLGPVVYWTATHPATGSPFADALDNGRIDADGRAGVRFSMNVERTTNATIPDGGWKLESELSGFPALWDVPTSFGTAAITGAAYIPLPGRGTHLGFRAGGAAATDDVPIQHAPTIGGKATLRGYRFQRYAGEQTIFGSAELRVPVGVLPVFIRWNTGVFGLADAGRVWTDGRSSGNWHTAIGGGVWFSTLGQTFSVAYARGEEGRLYLQRGLSF